MRIPDREASSGQSAGRQSPRARATTWLRADRRRCERRLWARWFDFVPTLRQEFAKAIEDDPLLYNETASCGVLASAASRAGLLALSEYSATKRGKGRGRPLRRGRCDLWVGRADGELSWAFEMKQLFCAGELRSATLASALQRACEDADAVRPLDADRRFGGLIVSGREGLALDRTTEARLEALAAEATFASRFEGAMQPVWLILRQVD